MMKSRSDLHGTVVWDVAHHGEWRVTLPLHAYHLIVDMDCPGRVAEVTVRARVGNPREELWFPPDLARFDSVNYRVWEEEAHCRAIAHSVRGMRDLYDRCRVHLKAEADRLEQLEWATWMRAEEAEHCA